MSNGPPIKLGFDKKRGKLEIEVRKDIIQGLQDNSTDVGEYRRFDYEFQPGDELADFGGVDDDEACRRIDIKLRG